MEPLALKDLLSNAFRVLGLTASATQAQIDSAARKMRIWQDPASIPATANDASWIGPVSRSPQDIENAVARLSEPESRLRERNFWFCLSPPESDALPSGDPSEICAFHDAAIVRLYHSLLIDAANENLDEWKAMIERFGHLARSDEYLQWMCEVESDGEFEKRASLDEIARAQRRLPERLLTAVTGSVDEALASGDFGAAAQAVQLIRDTGAPRSNDDCAELLLDRMEDDLAARCVELADRIDRAWKSRKLVPIRQGCNHVISRFGTHIRPMIDQLLLATTDIDRQNRAKMHGIRLLIHVSEAYEAIENFMAVDRTLQSALELAAGTPLEPAVANLMEKASPAIKRQRAGAPRGLRSDDPQRKEFKMLPGKINRDPWHESFAAGFLFRYALRYGAIGLVAAGLGLSRMACHGVH